MVLPAWLFIAFLLQGVSVGDICADTARLPKGLPKGTGAVGFVGLIHVALLFGWDVAIVSAHTRWEHERKIFPMEARWH